MLYVVLKEGKGEKPWHLGESVPNNSPDMVREIQADGDELAYIKRNFTNIPYHNYRPVITWYGEMAQFIFANLSG